MKVTIIYLTEPSYVAGLIDGLNKIDGLEVDLIGTDRTQVLENKFENINIINMRGSQDEKSSKLKKVARIINFYSSIFKYVVRTDSKVFHLHWANKFFWFDFTFLNLYYKLLGKKIVFTAHNIDQGMRDKNFGSANLIYKIHYKLVDKVIVHNEFSKRTLIKKFNLPTHKIIINKLGINKIVAKQGALKNEVRSKLNLSSSDKVLLFFGGLNPYKGLEILIKAFNDLVSKDNSLKLLIAGKPRDKNYFLEIEQLINNCHQKENILTYFDFIPDEEVEKFFIASDCCILPYKFIFQSGVHALSYAFGIPVIASDVGSFREEDVIEGKTGFIFKPDNVESLKNSIQTYFSSSLFQNLSTNREKIINWAEKNYSWDSIGKKTYNIYNSVLKN